MIDFSKSSQWLRRCDDLAGAGYHLLLTGNTVDRHLVVDETGDARSWLATTEVISKHFTNLGYELIVRYNLADRVTLANESTMVDLYDRAVRQAQGNEHVDSPTAEHGSSLPEPGRRQATTKRSDSAPRPADKSQALAAMCRALAQDQIATVIILENADRLFPEHLDGKELEDVVRLRRATEAAALMKGNHPLQGRKNLLVAITTGPISGVPSYLFREHPHMAVLGIPKPSRNERIEYLHQYLPEFHGGRSLNHDKTEAVANDLADLTDGMTLQDMAKLLRLSHIRSINVAENARQLVNQFKLGEQSDPWRDMDRERISNAEGFLTERVMGQDHVIHTIARSLKHAIVGLTSDPGGRGPKDVLFFAGPTGTGKTESAKAIADLLFRDSTAMTRLDMSEYAQEHAAERLVGAPPGYVGYDEGGQLTNAVRRKPHQIILLDEVEKANKGVWDKLLQVLEDGRLTDGQGQTAYFENSVLVFTSNEGATSLIDEFEPRIKAGDLPSYMDVQKHIRREVRNYFIKKVGRPEVLNRIGDERIVVFDLLRPEVVQSITRKFLNALSASARQQDLALEFEDTIAKYVARKMLEPDNLLMGGRRIKNLVRDTIEKPLTDWLFQNSGRLQGGIRIRIDVAEDGACMLINGERWPIQL